MNNQALSSGDNGSMCYEKVVFVIRYKEWLSMNTSSRFHLCFFPAQSSINGIINSSHAGDCDQIFWILFINGYRSSLPVLDLEILELSANRGAHHHNTGKS